MGKNGYCQVTVSVITISSDETSERVGLQQLEDSTVELARGQGKSKKAAESEAALAALMAIRAKKEPR